MVVVVEVSHGRGLKAVDDGGRGFAGQPHAREPSEQKGRSAVLWSVCTGKCTCTLQAKSCMRVLTV